MSFGCPSLIKKGAPCIHMTWCVPEDKEAEVDAFWKDHEQFMRKTHTIGCVFDDEKKSRLLHYYIGKGPQMVDFQDPSKGTTGKILYTMGESYVAEEDVKRHMDAAGEWEPFKDGTMMSMMQEYGLSSAVGSDKVFVGMADGDGAPSLIKKGAPCIHMTWAVPEDKEAEVDAFWKDHEQFMRKTHTIGCVFDDEKKSRLLHYYIGKGPQMVDFQDPSKGTTGKILYTMGESYVAEEDVKRHMDAAGGWEPMASGKMMSYMQEYGLSSAVGSDKVFVGMAD